jgi:hypothetical protein
LEDGIGSAALCPACPVGRNYRTGVEFTCDSGAYSSGVIPEDLSAFGGWYWGVQKIKIHTRIQVMHVLHERSTLFKLNVFVCVILCGSVANHYSLSRSDCTVRVSPRESACPVKPFFGFRLSGAVKYKYCPDKPNIHCEKGSCAHVNVCHFSDVHSPPWLSFRF